MALVELPHDITQGGKRVMVDSRIADTVEQIAHLFDLLVSSGWRSRTENREVGGAANSDHLRGLAVDFVGQESRRRNLYNWARGRFPYVEPWEQAKDHVHISFIRDGSAAPGEAGAPVAGSTAPPGCSTAMVGVISIGIALVFIADKLVG